MNARLAFEDHTTLHHRLDSLRAIDEVPEKPQLDFENRPTRETMREQASEFALEARSRREAMPEPIRDTMNEVVRNTAGATAESTQLAVGSRSQRELTREPEEKAQGMWRSILQLRVLLPYVSKLLPLLETGLIGQSAHSSAQSTNTALAAVEKNAIEIQNSHRELRLQLQDQAVEFKRVDEQLERLREATERNTLEQQELIEDLKSFAGTIKWVGWTAVVLLAGLVGAVTYVALHLKY
jgi:hypothetical protein